MSARASGKILRRWAEQTVLYDEPPISAPAALALLVRKYLIADKTIYKNNRMARRRKQWMKEQLKTPDSKGGLTCAICGKKGLQPFVKDKNKIATLDHIIELKENGACYDPNNFQVACIRCNTHRSATSTKQA